MFHNVNPTDKYVIAIDSNIAILIEDKDVALNIYNQVSSIEESPFGAMCLMMPRQVDKNIYGNVATKSILDERKIANADYIEKHTERTNKKYAGKIDVISTTTAKERLKDAKFDLMAELGFDSNKDWRNSRTRVA